MSVSQASWTRASLRRILASNNFEYTITGLILFNALLLGLDTVPAVSRQFARELDFLNDLILGIFVVELTLRMFAFGRDFWRHGWSWFDMFVVGIGLLPFAEGFTALRTLRVIRLLRIVSVVPSLRRVVEGLVRALPGLGAIVIRILVLLYVFSVMAAKFTRTSGIDRLRLNVGAQDDGSGAAAPAAMRRMLSTITPTWLSLRAASRSGR